MQNANQILPTAMSPAPAAPRPGTQDPHSQASTDAGADGGFLSYMQSETSDGAATLDPAIAVDPDTVAQPDIDVDLLSETASEDAPTAVEFSDPALLPVPTEGQTPPPAIAERDDSSDSAEMTANETAIMAPGQAIPLPRPDAPAGAADPVLQKSPASSGTHGNGPAPMPALAIMASDAGTVSDEQSSAPSPTSLATAVMGQIGTMDAKTAPASVNPGHVLLPPVDAKPVVAPKTGRQNRDLMGIAAAQIKEFMPVAERGTPPAVPPQIPSIGAVKMPPTDLTELSHADFAEAAASDPSGELPEFRVTADLKSLDAPRLGVPNAATASSAPSMARNVTTQLIAELSRGPNNTTEIQLSPEELGKVRLSLSTQEGAALVVIAAERPETVESIRRNMDELAREMRSLGYESVDFQFEDRNPRADQQDLGPDERAPIAAPPEPEPAVTPQRVRVTLDSMDLRI